MPHIIVTAETPSDRGEGPVLLRERITLSDFESEHFTRHLVERLGWAVEDAHELQQQGVQDGGDPADPATRSTRQLTSVS
jgi:hypothetical protein